MFFMERRFWKRDIIHAKRVMVRIWKVVELGLVVLHVIKRIPIPGSGITLHIQIFMENISNRMADRLIIAKDVMEII